ncbi:MAG: hypothetical protein PHF37_10005 [Phycisphaerae bacterium]|nr:hypothetical protein [Phycisphaerae bacterium]
MAELKIHNWDKWQTYRKDRGQPPWIKVYRRLLRNMKWIKLTDAQRGQLVAIWLLAGDHDGVIPASSEDISKLCYLSDPLDLQFFIDQGFIENGVKLASTWRQHDAPEAETEAETEAEAETDKSTNKAAELNGQFAKQLLDYWNTKARLPKVERLTGKRRDAIKTRAKESFFVDHWKEAIDRLDASDFCTGKNESGWKATLEFLLKNDNNITKIIEGNYDNRQRAISGKPNDTGFASQKSSRTDYEFDV